MKQLFEEALKRYNSLKEKVATLSIVKVETASLMATIEDTFNEMNEAIKTNNNKWFQEQLLLIKVLLDGLEIQMFEKP
ncbi:MAG TPA: hypothetical protein VIO64_02530 [Pseudobacteroides sp.]|uniref:hypothetical protein n=1 Tax=Pseudobacteroides sp. TaxID=1968840 RepID=UPI002F949410